MAANVTLIPVKQQGWTAGLANLIKRETAGLKSRRGLGQLVIWMLIVNGLLLTALKAPETLGDSGGLSLLEQAAQLICVVLGFICPVGIMIASQSAIIGEKQNGTAAWILSKPVSRVAFVLAKFLSANLIYLVSAVLLPGIVAYFLMVSFGLSLQITAMLEGMALLYLNLIFYQSFTLMVGTFVNSRRTVIGASLGLILVIQFVQKSFGMYLPGYLPLDAAAVMANHPLPGVISLVETVGLSILFLWLAFWRFSREEF